MDDPVLRVQFRLTDRDRTLLGWLYDHGVLTSFQISAALFPSLDFCQRRLRTLTGLRLIQRFRPHRPDGGSYPYHYVIAQLGAETIAAARGERPPRREHARTEHRRWTAGHLLAHRLGVNQFFTGLAAHARTHPRTELAAWWSESTCRRPGAFVRPGDPALLHAYQPRVRPDGYGEWREDNVTVPFFLEYDTGTEPLYTLVNKLDGYTDLARALGRVWPVLFWLHSPARERNLQHLLTDQPVAVPVATGHRAGTPLPAGEVWAVAHTGWYRHRLSALAQFTA
ncbi:replication-relaxation family protein [Dactylosporangium vinaceum]|uniref:Replication-relaxation family protein n=1 Tax=Dactylosporangium vinaceum TaxID=53362 RepID=A0ABV5MLE8_9ACTN|nr:replication-relaxation family protein [Dactylosporangium vinaceum]UAB96977.1 replication-relaxation family protein [Dactylosporangium vinaceum]